MMISNDFPLRVLMDGDIWNDPSKIFATLDSLWPQQILSTGGEYNSTDIHAINWARKRNAEVVYYMLETSIDEVISEHHPTFLLSFLNRDRPEYENWLEWFGESHNLPVLIVKGN